MYTDYTKCVVTLLVIQKSISWIRKRKMRGVVMSKFELFLTSGSVLIIVLSIYLFAQTATKTIYLF